MAQPRRRRRRPRHRRAGSRAHRKSNRRPGTSGARGGEDGVESNRAFVLRGEDGVESGAFVLESDRAFVLRRAFVLGAFFSTETFAVHRFRDGLGRVAAGTHRRGGGARARGRVDDGTETRRRSRPRRRGWRRWWRRTRRRCSPPPRAIPNRKNARDEVDDGVPGTTRWTTMTLRARRRARAMMMMTLRRARRARARMTDGTTRRFTARVTHRAFHSPHPSTPFRTLRLFGHLARAPAATRSTSARVFSHASSSPNVSIGRGTSTSTSFFGSLRRTRTPSQHM